MNVEKLIDIAKEYTPETIVYCLGNPDYYEYMEPVEIETVTEIDDKKRELFISDC